MQRYRMCGKVTTCENVEEKISSQAVAYTVGISM